MAISNSENAMKPAARGPRLDKEVFFLKSEQFDIGESPEGSFPENREKIQAKLAAGF
ncbi:MAG TPA: hypothetical protein VN517_07825 [Terriglobales bacterium]|nr:hypothetical protein [Terriglobales bacterium]